jgi:hypothetical protein
MPAFEEKEAKEIYDALGSYVQAFITSADGINAQNVIVKPAVFRAAMLLFSEVAQRVKDKHGQYNVDNFFDALKPLFRRLKASTLTNAPTSYTQLHAGLSQTLRTSFTL